MEKIKIAHINNISQLSGSQLVSLEILQSLSNEKFEKYIICGRHEAGIEEFLEKCEEANVKSIILDSQKRNIGLNDFKYLKSLINILKKESFDIIHTNSSKPGLFGRIAAKFVGTKYILHTVHGIAFHNQLNIFSRSFFFLIEIFSSLFCDQIILVNNYYNKYYKWMFWVSKKTIYNGIHPTKDYYSIYNISRPLLNFQIIFLGRLEFQKDPITYLKSINYIKENYLEIYNKTLFTLVGEGDLKNECVNFINKYNLGKQVQILDWTDNKWELLSKSSILVAPSLYEAFGLIFLEAGMMHIPVIATNVEGIPEVIIDKETGFLVEPRDYKLLAKKIIELRNDFNLLKKMGDQNYLRVISQFKLEDKLNEYKKLYENKFYNNYS